MHVYIPKKHREWVRILVHNVLYVPKLGVILLVMSKITAIGFLIIFCATKCHIYNHKNKLIGKIPVTGNLYYVETDTPVAMHSANALISISLDGLHQMMGHISPNAAKRLVKGHIVEGIVLNKAQPTPTSCNSCEYGKKTRKAVAKISNHKHAKEL